MTVFRACAVVIPSRCFSCPVFFSTARRVAAFSAIFALFSSGEKDVGLEDLSGLPAGNGVGCFWGARKVGTLPERMRLEIACVPFLEH